MLSDYNKLILSYIFYNSNSILVKQNLLSLFSSELQHFEPYKIEAYCIYKMTERRNKEIDKLLK